MVRWMKKNLCLFLFNFVCLYGAESPSLPPVVKDIILDVLNENPPVYKAPPTYNQTFYEELPIYEEPELSSDDSFYEIVEEKLPSYTETMEYAIDSFENEQWVLRMPFSIPPSTFETTQ
ncbi:MAG: hypothetical protein HEEMFOPI_01837 [Holosporales bacterium]